MANHHAYFAEHYVRFEFRKSRAQRDAITGTVYAVIYVAGQGSELCTTQIRCSYSDWQSRGASRSPESVKKLERSLVLWKETVFSAARSLFSEGKPITPRALLDEVNYANCPLLTAEQVFQKFLNFKQKRVGPDRAEHRLPGQICQRTFDLYQNRWSAFQAFLKAKRKEKILLSAIDTPMISEFYHFTLSQACTPATATKRVQMVTELCQWALNQGLIRELRTNGFRGVSKADKLPYNVSEEEVSRIEAIDMPTTLARFRDGWLLARELCLHYSDYIDIKPNHFSLDKQGRLIFNKLRIKQEAGRNIRQVSIVSERAQSIWYRYGQQIPHQAKKGNYNKYLKYIGDMAELSQPLTFSHARDSGIFRLVANGCPDFVTKLAAGWTTLNQLTRYVNHDQRLLEEYVMPPTIVSHKEASLSAYGSLTRSDQRSLLAPVKVEEAIL